MITNPIEPLPKKVEIIVTLSVGYTGLWNDRELSLWKTRPDSELPGGYVAAFSSGADKVVIGGVVYRKVDDVATNSSDDNVDDPCRLYNSGCAKRKLIYERVDEPSA